MSTLGEILASLRDRSQVISLLAEAGDARAIVAIDSAADLSGRDPCELALDAVHAFTEQASDEAWVRLIGRIQNADAPAAACLAEIVTWSLEHAGATHVCGAKNVVR